MRWGVGGCDGTRAVQVREQMAQVGAEHLDLEFVNLVALTSRRVSVRAPRAEKKLSLHDRQ